MRKIIEASSDMNDKSKALVGLAALSILDKGAKKRSRQKLMNDIMYYLRKLLNLAKQVQNMSEGVNPDLDLEKQNQDFEDLKREIDDLESLMGSK